jgi:hypothetical protein
VNNGTPAETLDVTGTAKISGNVGIGTSASPSRQLHIKRDTSNTTPMVLIEEDGTGDPTLQFLTTGESDWTIGIDNSESDEFAIAYGSALGSTTKKFVLDISGNVKIGTTASAASSGAENLIVGSGSGSEGMTIYSGTGDFGSIYFSDSSSSDAGQYRGIIRYGHGGSGEQMEVFTNSTKRMIIDSEGTVDQQGNYTVNEQGRQNHVANTMSSPYYRFDSVDDLINLGSDANLDDIFDNGGTVAGWIHPLSVGNDSGRVLDKNKWVLHQKLESNGFTTLQLYVYFDGNDGWWHTGSILENGKWTHIAVAYDSSSVSNNPVFYINGVSVTVTEEGTPTGTRDTDASESLYIGNKADGSRGFDGFMSGIQLWNTEISSSEAKELYSGASVVYRYKGANQTTLFDSGADVFTSGTYSWVAYGSNNIANTSNQLVITYVDNASGAYLYLRDATNLSSDLTVGKKYRFSADAKYAGGSAGVTLGLNDGSSDLASSALTTSMTNLSIEFTANSSTGCFVRLLGMGASNVVTLDNLSLVQIGAVAEYDGSGITANKWYDGSGNELHGTVSGASDENTASAPVLSDNHPAFLVQPNAEQSNLAVDSTVDIVFDVERFDQGSNFASNTFTAPVTGKYFLNFSLYGKAIDSASPYIQVYITTSNRTYTMIIDPDVFGQDATYWSFNNSVLADMDVNDTAKIQVFQSSGTAQLDIGTASYFSGYLVC